jgi:NAD+ diphosphatase
MAPSMAMSPGRHALAFTGASLDRADMARKDPERVRELTASEDAVVVASTAESVVLDGHDPVLKRIPANGWLAPDEAVLLGVESGKPLFAIDLEALEDTVRQELIGDGRLVMMREAGLELSGSEGGLAAYLSSLLNWHRRNRFCANCGTRTAIADAGMERRCPNCGAHHFPRLDPVVIMLVEHEDRILMGSRVGAPEGRYSVLAGFVSPGETPEEAVIREVKEESGIDAYDARYIAAQPWPFPSSLMLGFFARADGGEPVIGDGELADVRWFTREEVAAASRGEAWFKLPWEVSIARTLIERWLAGE